jgi:hypothetical protein
VGDTEMAAPRACIQVGLIATPVVLTEDQAGPAPTSAR